MHEIHTNPPAESQSRDADWTTRVDPAFTRPFEVEELHNVCFEPNGWPGRGDTLALLIPECELQSVWAAADGEPVALVNRPQKNKSIGYWLRRACETATSKKAFITFSCDTAEQARWVANRAAKLLPNHRRMALERVFDPAGRARGGLS